VPKSTTIIGFDGNDRQQCMRSNGAREIHSDVWGMTFHQYGRCVYEVPRFQENARTRPTRRR
jgi:hypothetical protein